METKVKVKVIKRYNDISLNKIQEKDTEFETTETRAKYLAEQGMVEIVGDVSKKTGKTEGKEQ
jgi:hypothetical protein